MSKSKEKYVPVYFRKAPPKTGYFAGRVHDVPESKAKQYIKDGYGTKPTEVLPKDFPYRKELIAAGIETVDEVKDAKDLTSVKGIGDAAEKQIAVYLYGEADDDESSSDDDDQKEGGNQNDSSGGNEEKKSSKKK